MGRFLPDLLGTLGPSFGIGPKATRATVNASGLSAARTFALPDKAGTVALLSDVAVADGMIDGDGNNATVINTTAETVLQQVTIPANTLQTNRAVHVRLLGQYLNTGSGTTFTIKVKYGATTLYAATSGAMAASANRHAVDIDLMLCAGDATNSQVLGGCISVSSPTAPTTGYGPLSAIPTATTGANTSILGTSTEDSTVDKVLQITIQHSAASSGIAFQSNYFIAALEGAGLKGDQSAPSADYISGLMLSYVDATHVQVGTGAAAIQSSGALENVTTAISAAIPSPAASTWYHVYLYDNAGSPAVEVSTTAPASPYLGTARSKTGDTTRRYLGSVLTDASGNLLKFKQVRDSMWYETDVTAGSLRVLGSGTATASTSVDCSGAVPLTADVAHLYVANTSTAAPLRFSNADGPTVPSAFLANTSTSTSQMVDVPLSSQAFTYAFNGSPATGIAFIGVAAYRFAR